MVEATKKVHEVHNIPPIFEKNTLCFLPEENTSSIAPAENKETYTPSKPILDNPIQKMIERYVGRIEPSVDRWSRFKESGIQRKINEVEEQHRQEAIKLEEAAQAAKDVTFWGILEDIGSSVMGAVSSYFGFAALSGGATTVGGVLIISGVLTLGNLAFKHANVWDWIADQMGGKNEELKQQIRTYLPPAIGVIGAAMGIYGSYAAWNYAAQTGMKQITSILQSTSNVALALSAYTTGISYSALKNATGDLSFLQSNMELSRLSLERSVDDLKDFHEGQTKLHTKIGNILEETNQTIQAIQQPV